MKAVKQNLRKKSGIDFSENVTKKPVMASTSVAKTEDFNSRIDALNEGRNGKVDGSCTHTGWGD